MSIILGLAFICKTFNVQYKEIADYMGIKPQTINDWLKGRKKIPRERIKQLGDYFNIQEHFFQKELDELEKIEVQKKAALKKATFFEIPTLIEDNKSEPYLVMEKYSDMDDIIDILDAKKRQIQLLTYFKEYIATENEDYPYNDLSLEFLEDIKNVIKDNQKQKLLKIFVYIITNHTEKQPNYVEISNEKEKYFMDTLIKLLHGL